MTYEPRPDPRGEAFTAMVTARSRSLQRAACLMLGDPQRAEDLTQEALVTTCCRKAITTTAATGEEVGPGLDDPPRHRPPRLDGATLAVIRQTRFDRASPPLELLTCDVVDGGCEVVAALPSFQDLVGGPRTLALATGTSTQG